MIRRAISVALLSALIAVLVWLRDPAWLLTSQSGFERWRADADGVPYHWTGGHASFFVPSNASGIRIPVRTGREGDWPVTVSISIDGKLADQLKLVRNEWQTSRLRLPRPGSRRVRRIDIHANRTEGGGRSVQVGEVDVMR